LEDSAAGEKFRFPKVGRHDIFIDSVCGILYDNFCKNRKLQDKTYLEVKT
jgi:hypothetical protein